MRTLWEGKSVPDRQEATLGKMRLTLSEKLSCLLRPLISALSVDPHHHSEN